MATIIRLRDVFFDNPALPIVTPLVSDGLLSCIRFPNQTVSQQYGDLDITEKSAVKYQPGYAIVTASDGYFETNLAGQKSGTAIVCVRIRQDVLNDNLLFYPFGFAIPGGADNGVSGWLKPRVSAGSGSHGLGIHESDNAYTYAMSSDLLFPTGDEWKVLAFRWDATSIDIYDCAAKKVIVSQDINGVTDKLGPLTIGTTANRIGNGASSNGKEMDMAEFLIYNRKLTDSELHRQFTYSRDYLVHLGITPDE